MGSPKVWGHRGASGYAPENTLEAFQLAVEMEADGVELDVQLSKDGELVVIHDESIDRVSNGKGLVKDYYLHELKGINFNNSHSGYEFVTIPTLEEVFCLLKDTGLCINVELKTGRFFYEGIEEKVLKLAERMQMENRIIYSSFNHYTLVKIKNLNREAKIGFLYTDGIYEVSEYCRTLGADAIHPPVNNLKFPDLIESCKEFGINMHVWNIRDEDINMCCDVGVDAVITNYPDRTRAIIKNYCKGR